MSDTPVSTVEPQTPERSFWGRLADGRARALFGTAYAIAFLITAAAIWLVAIAPGATAGGDARTAASQVVLFILLANLILIAGLAAVIGGRVLRLTRNRNDPGARLHLRFVTLFSLVSVVPAVLIALVFGLLVNRGVDQWFSTNVRSAVENGAEIGRAYVADVGAGLEVDLETMATELGGVRDLFDNRIQFSRALSQIGDFFGYPALYILDDEGRVLASGEQPGAPPYVAPPREAFETVAGGEVAPTTVTENPDMVRALYPLPDYGHAYLYVVRPLAPGLIQRMRNGEESITAYRAAEESRARIQAAFALSYLETALLVLVGAVWLAMSAASSISAPIGRLVKAADQVAGGDLDARVDNAGAPSEIIVLSEAFNRMTEDIKTQQAALKTASDEAQGRSLFIETVLSGVSAGVIGLDRMRRISAINDSASQLLGLDPEQVQGLRLADVAPELGELSERGEAHIEEDIDVSRDGEALRLRVRIEGGQGGEMVLTFDDITRLVTAQRNAAWRDVARRIAHEIKNPLTPIQLSAERLRRRYRERVGDDVEVFDRCTETIIRQVGDIGRMVDEFSSFARMPAPRFSMENPAEMLREAVFAQRVAVPDIGVDLVEPLPSVVLQCDGRMVGQALANILKNAGEAVGAKRARDPVAEEALGIIARLDIEDERAVFTIEDDGVGLPAKDRDRLTEPYVTTREKGTGLGLAIVKRICEDHGGELRLADAETLSGARVCLIFPLTQNHKSAHRASGAASVAS
ncbi:Sporulation kinase E [Brevundimonas diminuta]|uniref:histidine kinase n=1 Tax=Brevundimonas diminuta TaxID=293 RepID=A0A246KFL6_BREDI|nr:PAS domain-containing sensor histidine kinase [Brevundimonas diminuta]ASD28296.1 HAMP domain-containing histidine kinase [Brevundimonas diminuta]EGF94452.1 nitrogen regulation protein ntrY [Brevundimonas diminuta ATCC 11568]OWR20575.1 HAMP domain-containing histidine kinase [Brevundimonas diminuta]WQE46786.1 PAS domain-containing sensor histidine kinase [Brevundimonas diminuta]SPU47742.1 Sporulation kinase E [Brevundimonas diminuta]